MNTLKSLIKTLLFVAIVGFLVGCDEDDPAEPEPVTLAFSLQSATLDGNAISPTPVYSLTVNFDKDGNPNGYSASGTATYQPSVGTSGTFSISGSQVTFTSGSDSRTANITGGSLTNTSTSVSLQFELSKIDDGVPLDDEGTYVYQMAL